jgi:hypothetical protein
MEWLLDRLFLKAEDGIWFSRKTRIAACTGDDSKLYIAWHKKSTLIWWQNNRGDETTIFDGVVNNANDLLKLFELLCVENLLDIK